MYVEQGVLIIELLGNFFSFSLKLFLSFRCSTHLAQLDWNSATVALNFYVSYLAWIQAQLEYKRTPQVASEIS